MFKNRYEQPVDENSIKLGMCKLSCGLGPAAFTILWQLMFKDKLEHKLNENSNKLGMC